MFQLGAVFGAAYLSVSTPTIAINGFLKTGIYPMNQDVFSDHDFAPSEVTDQSSSDNLPPVQTLQPLLNQRMSPVKKRERLAKTRGLSH